MTRHVYTQHQSKGVVGVQKRRLVSITGGMLLGASLLAACGTGGAENGKNTAAGGCGDFPSDNFEYLIAFDPGGESDRTARMQQKPLEDILDQNITIKYKPGGGGALAWSTVADLEPDGYTLVGYNMPHIVLQPIVRKEEAGYETSDLEQVYMFQLTPYILAVGPDSEFSTFEELVDAAKENPGEISIGGVGKFTGPHLVHLKLQQAMPDVKFEYVPFTGTGDLIPAVLGGHVDVAITNTPAVVANPDNLTGLALAAEEPMEVLADVPTLPSLGVDVVEGAYRGVAVPPGTPECRIEFLADAIGEVNTSESFAATMKEQGFILVDYGPEEATQFIQERISSYEELLTEMGVI